MIISIKFFLEVTFIIISPDCVNFLISTRYSRTELMVEKIIRKFEFTQIVTAFHFASMSKMQLPNSPPKFFQNLTYDFVYR